MSSIFFATPCHRASPQRVAELQKFARKSVGNIQGSHVVSVVSNNPWIFSARADLVAAFRASKCDHMFFRDDDITFAPELLERMVALNLPLVAVPYRLRLPPHGWALRRVDDLLLAGLGCCLIQREVIIAMWDHFSGQLGYSEGDQPRVALFDQVFKFETDNSVMRRRQWKEDHAFFLRAAECRSYLALMSGKLRHQDIPSEWNAEEAAKLGMWVTGLPIPLQTDESP